MEGSRGAVLRDDNFPIVEVKPMCASGFVDMRWAGVSGYLKPEEARILAALLIDAAMVVEKASP